MDGELEVLSTTVHLGKKAVNMKPLEIVHGQGSENGTFVGIQVAAKQDEAFIA
jgi:hypothetical protein